MFVATSKRPKSMEFLTELINFVVFTVIVKIIIGHWMAQQITKYSKSWFATTERKWAIWEHYQHRARGEGHNFDSVLDCTQDSCVVFHV